jgi:hypothetical protein
MHQTANGGLVATSVKTMSRIGQLAPHDETIGDG